MASVLAATKSQNIRILELLLQGPTSKQDVDQSLFYACTDGLTECVQCLLESGVDPDTVNNSGNRPIHVATLEGHAAVVDALFRAGASVNVKGSGNNGAIHIASRHDREECLQVLLDNKCDLNLRDATQNTSLIIAVKHKQYSAISLLLNTPGCSVNAADSAGRTALHFASLSGTAVEQLLRAGADVNLVDTDESSPLLYASTEGLDRVISCLIQAPKCDVNLANRSVGKTPLHILAYKGHDKAVRWLMEFGAISRSPDKEGKTAMWYAVANGHVRVVRELLTGSFDMDSYECPPEAPSTICPVQLAVDKGLTQILKMFLMTLYDVRHLRSCVQKIRQDDTFSGGDKDRFLSAAMMSVPALRQLTRKYLRHYLTQPVTTNVHQLPIPKKIVRYILMEDLED